MVMEALAELQGDMKELKEERRMARGGAADVRENVNRRPTEVIGYGSSPGFSGFQSVQQHDSSSDSDIQDVVSTGSVLL